MAIAEGFDYEQKRNREYEEAKHRSIHENKLILAGAKQEAEFGLSDGEYNYAAECIAEVRGIQQAIDEQMATVDYGELPPP